MIRILGGQRLTGNVTISGAKNSALPAIFASLLTTEPLVLRRVPRLLDVETAVELVRALGKEARWEDDVLRIWGGEELRAEAPAELVQKMRASFLVLGPLVARLGRAKVALPGGCALGPRPVDFHLHGLARLGARVELDDGAAQARASQLKGTTIYLDFPSVGATEQLLLAGALAHGQTMVVNPAREPEVTELAVLLEKMGAKVHWGLDHVSIQGCASLSGAEHTIIPDRIEAGTYLLAGAITQGRVRALSVCPEHLRAFLDRLALAGAEIEVGATWVEVRTSSRPTAVDFRTWPYPGFPTDLQPPMVALLAYAEGRATVTENVYAARFGHVEPLLQMGAKIQVTGNVLVVEGREHLRGTRVEATDIRAGAALVLAALAAEGVSFVAGAHHLARGYADLGGKLRALGAHIWEEGD